MVARDSEVAFSVSFMVRMVLGLAGIFIVSLSPVDIDSRRAIRAHLDNLTADRVTAYISAPLLIMV